MKQHKVHLLQKKDVQVVQNRINSLQTSRKIDNQNRLNKKKRTSQVHQTNEIVTFMDFERS